MENRIGINRSTPKSEPKYVREYLKQVKAVKGMDVSAVTTLDGIPGYGQLPEKFNRSRDKDPHRVKSFISSEDLRKAMKR